MIREHVVSDVGRKLRKLGFKRKGNTWRREGDVGIEVFNIQGSQWGSGKFYLNVGIYLFNDRNLREPHEYDCQLRERVEHEGRSDEEVFETIRSWFERQTRSIAERARPPMTASESIRVRHAKFGAGRIIADYGNTVKVEFDDGNTRLLAKSFVEVV